jgi:hypothetical protein
MAMSKKADTVLGALLLAAGFPLLLWWMWNDAADRPPSDDQCSKDPTCWNNRHAGASRAACTAAIEAQLRYAHEWDAFRFPEARLGPSATLVLSGAGLRAQNGFGAWQNMRYTCIYDPAARSAVVAALEQK